MPQYYTYQGLGYLGFNPIKLYTIVFNAVLQFFICQPVSSL